MRDVDFVGSRFLLLSEVRSRFSVGRSRDLDCLGVGFDCFLCGRDEAVFLVVGDLPRLWLREPVLSRSGGKPLSLRHAIFAFLQRTS